MFRVALAMGLLVVLVSDLEACGRRRSRGHSSCGSCVVQTRCVTTCAPVCPQPYCGPGVGNNVPRMPVPPIQNAPPPTATTLPSGPVAPITPGGTPLPPTGGDRPNLPNPPNTPTRPPGVTEIPIQLAPMPVEVVPPRVALN